MSAATSDKKRRGAPLRGAQIGLGLRLRDAYRAFTRALDEGLAEHDVTHLEWVHLWFIWQADNEATANYVSRCAGIKKASSTAALHSLQDRGLIRRVRDVEDTRRVKLILTPAGETKMKELLKVAIRVNRAARGSLPDRKIEALFTLLREIASNLSAPQDARDRRTNGGRDVAAEA